MAIAFVQNNGQKQSTTSATSFAINITAAPSAGNLVVARWSNSVAAATGVTDTKGNTWTIAGTAGSTAFCGLAYSFQNVATLTTSDTVSVSYGSSVGSFVAKMDEFSGVSSSSPIDGTVGTASFSSTTSRSSGSVTTTNANDLIIGAFAVNGTDTFTQGSGYTALTSFANGVNYTTEGEYQIVSSTGTYSPTGTGTGTVSGGGVSVAFKAAGSAPANTVAPVVSGTTVRGSTLSTTNGTWTDDGSPTFTYQWQRDNSGGGVYGNISAATSSTYVLAAADVGCNIRCVVTDNTPDGNTAANSNSVGLITAPALSTIVGKTGTSGTAVMQKAATGYTYVSQSTNAPGTTPIDQKGAPGFTKVKGH